MTRLDFDLTDEQWNKICHHFDEPAASKPKVGRPRRDRRQILNGILWIKRSGSPWRTLPRDLYGPYKTVFHLFNEWSESGLLETIFEEIAEIGDRTQIQIDSTISRAHQSSAGAKKGDPNHHKIR